MRDPIDRQAAIDALWKSLHAYEDKTERQFIESDELDVGDWMEHRIFVQNMNDSDRQAILELPSADIDLSGFSDRLWKAAYERGKAEVVRNGHWIYTPTNLLGYACSECGKAMCRFNYCPHCGAKME